MSAAPSPACMNATRESWRLAWPLILSNLSVPMLGVVDTAVVGHLDAPRYLGGVALGALVMSVLYRLFGFLRMGTTALTAQAFGANDTGETRAAVGRAMLVALGLGLLVILVGPLVILVGERLFAPSPEVGVEFERYLGRSGCSGRPRRSPAWCCSAGCSGCRTREGRCC